MHKKIIYILSAAILLIGLLFGYTTYEKIFGKAVIKNGTIYIYKNDNLSQIQEKISALSKRPEDFLWVAEKKKFTTPKTGKYLLKKGMSMNHVVNLLRSGNQTPVKISFNNQNSIEKLAGRVAKQIATDSISLVNAFRDSLFLSEKSLNTKSVLGICIPNSYEVYWTISAEKFRDKMWQEYQRFWTKKRLAKAKEIHLIPQEVITLASIVQEETKKVDEKPIVAGLYLNRLKKGWPIQSDPTVKYAVQQEKGEDFVIKRVLHKDIEATKNSPYNTYTNKGLPPSLIVMPDISSIDAVLNASKHNYLYMCVNVDKIGYHAFASSLAAHNRNAAKYHRWLNKQKIFR